MENIKHEDKISELQNKVHRIQKNAVDVFKELQFNFYANNFSATSDMALFLNHLLLSFSSSPTVP
jgi:hypothetical protein